MISEIIHNFKVVFKINCGAAPCGTELIKKFNTKAPKGVIFKEGWGMTEVAGGACVMNRAYQSLENGSVNLVNPNFRCIRPIHEEETD